MDIKKELNQVYNFYLKGDYKAAQELNNRILEFEQNNVYALRYAKLLSAKISNSSDKKAKIRGKTLKCPHCLVKIPFSGLTEEQRNKIKSGEYNNLEIKCPYCHTKFVLQKKKAKSILGIKIGDIANIDGKKYRVVGYVEYSGHWYEDGYSGGVKYLEWLLLGENNEYKYFSEGKSSDDGIWENEFSVSEKYIPKQIGNIDYIRQIVEIDGRNLYAKEVDKLKVVSVYGENSKNIKVGEEVEIYDFGDIIIEKESSGAQNEAGIYRIKEFSGSEAANIFGKEYNNLKDTQAKSSKGGGIFFIIIFWLNFSIFMPEYFWLGFGIISLLLLFYPFKDKFGKKGNIILAGIFIIPISAFLIFRPIFNSILEDKKLIKLEKVGYGKKYELNFSDPSLKKEKVVSRISYDYGGTRTYYKRVDGLKFSVKDKQDLEVIDKIRNLKYNSLNSINEEKIEKMFKGKIYKLK